MKKLLALSFLLLCVSAQSLQAKSAIADAIRSNPALRSVVGLGGLCLIFGAGEMTRETDKPKWAILKNHRVSDLAKSITAAAMLTWYEILMSDATDDIDLMENLIKVGLVTGTNYTANTEFAGNLVRPIPGIGGLLSDSKDDGKERFGFGRLSRCILTYMIYRGAAQHAGLIR